MSRKGWTEQSETRANAGVYFQGVVYGGSGYADGNQGVLMALAQHQVPVQLVPAGLQSDTTKHLSPNVRTTLERMKGHRVNLAQSVFYQCGPADQFNLHKRGRYKIGRTAYETDRIPDGWVEHCHAMDEVWIPSEFNRETFARSGVHESKLRVMPEGVNTSVYRPDVEPLNIPHTRRFNFLSVFEWIQRKGPDALLRAYLTEFKPDEDVTLIVKVYALNDPFADLEARLISFVEREMGLTLDKTPPIILLNGFLPNADIPRLYAAADAFVLPSRGEGWGRPYMEAAASELPVIATRWSGHLDFLHDRNSYLIDLDGVVPAPPDLDVEYYAGHCWANPSVDHLRQLMRHVFSHPEEARQRAVQARAEMVERWDWNLVSELWANEFHRLLA